MEIEGDFAPSGGKNSPKASLFRWCSEGLAVRWLVVNLAATTLC